MKAISYSSSLSLVRHWAHGSLAKVAEGQREIPRRCLIRMELTDSREYRVGSHYHASSILAFALKQVSGG